MSTEKLFYPLFFGFLFGILFNSFLSFKKEFLFLLFWLSIFLSFLVFFFRKYEVSKESFSAIPILLFLLAFSLGGVRLLSVDEALQKDKLSLESLPASILLRGMVSKEPEKGEMNLRAVVSLSEGVLQGKTLSLSGNILVIFDRNEKVSYGDELLLSGTKEEPKNFFLSSGKEFDYESFLEKDGIISILRNPKVSEKESGKGNIIISVLLKGKEAFVSSLERTISFPESSLAGGIILGEKTLPKENNDDFRKAGLSHIIVLSGYNLSLVAKAVVSFLEKLPLPRWGTPLGASLSIIAFTLASGGSAAAVRAAVMALVIISASFLRRKSDSLRALFFAAFAMLLWNPKLLAFDVGFELSFLATFAILVISPVFEKFLGFITEKLGVREIVASTLSVSFFLLPFLLYEMGTFSLLSLPANLLVLPFIPLAMFLSIFAGFFGILFSFLGILFGYPTALLLSYMLFVAKFFAGFSFATITSSTFSLWAMILSYIFLGLLFIFLKRKLPA
ncbi:MAG: ComEC/Rec2 family competence protein [Patescibacteria group bacterium]